MGQLDSTQAVTEATEEQNAEQQAQGAASTEGGQEATEEPSQGSTEQQPAEGGEGAESASSPLWEGVADDHPLRQHVKSLNDENAAKRIENRRLTEAYEQLQEQTKDAKTPEEFQAAITEYTEKLDAAQVETLRERVARQHGLPDPLVDRLRGTTEEELVADAQALQALVGERQPEPTPRNPPTGGLEPNKPKPEDPASMAERIRNSRW